jgi:multicomponent Na+:H+ antiporter subunit D
MSLIGIPLFFGFSAKANALIALFSAGNIWLPIVILLMAVVEGAYFIRMITKLWNPGEEGEKPTKEMMKEYSLQGCARVGITTVIIALVIIAVGVIALSNLSAPAGTDFLTFIKQSIGGM